MTLLYEQKKSHCSSWWRMSPTLRCNYSCQYCAVDFNHRADAEMQFERRKISPDQWVHICKKFDTPGIIITGGEPFLYPGLIDIIERVEKPLHIFTNLCLVTDELVKRLCARGTMKIFASYHHQEPNAPPLEEFARKIKALTAGGINCRVGMVMAGKAHGARVRKIRHRLKSEFKISDIKVTANAWDAEPWSGAQGEGPAQSARCRTWCLRLLGPDGFRYPCESKMVRGVGPMEDMLTEQPAPMHYETTCDEFGLCLICDRQALRKIETPAPT